jgi:phosphoribosylformimino-5-aminoimidazole carboxamide ribotide isomerase
MIDVIPAMDILDGRCVRLSQGDYDRPTVYNDHPLEVAKQFEAHGIRRLHLVDLDGAKAHRIINYRVLEQIASRTSLIIDFGGGLKSDTDLEIAFDSGANRITGGSIAVKNPEQFQRWIDTYGASAIVLGADCRERKIAVAGWLEATDEDVLPFIHRWHERGIVQVICTDISKDGMLNGPAIDLYQDILADTPQLHLIASGGVATLDDIECLHQARVPAVIVGKALYEGRITLSQISRFLC